MRNCLILGCGRSGTSMLSGTLNGAGYYMGGKLYRPRKANPKGFFEAIAINAINEKLLSPLAPSRSRHLFLRIWRAGFPSERWLARIPVGTPIHVPSRITRRIRQQVARRPFAFKDPRFCYTLPAWRPQLPSDTVFLCIFREPGRTVASIIKECRARYPDIAIDEKEAFGVWTDMYTHILHTHCHEGTWLFVHYDQVLDGSALPVVEEHLGVRVDRSFADARLKRAPLIESPESAAAAYRELCTLAGYAA